MTRTNIDLDDDALASVMRWHGFKTKREAVNFALRTVAVEPMAREEMAGMRGSGWDGDLAELRRDEHAGALEQASGTSPR